MAVVVRLVGTFRVQAEPGGSDRVIGSAKERRLLALLAARHGQVVPPDRLVGALWAGPPPARATRNVATLVSRLRAQLGADVIVGDHRGYRIGAAVDVAEAARLVEEAQRRLDAGTPAPAEAAAVRAVELL